MWQYNHTNELYHHGILGMKWGRRKVQSLNNKITNAKKTGKTDVKEIKEIGQYHNKDVTKDIAKSQLITDKRVTKLQSKKEKIQKTLDGHATRGTQNAIDKVTTGKAVAQSLLLGNYGALVYNAVRNKGATKGQAAVQAVMNEWGNNLTFGEFSRRAKW